jgi:hypothetical protein
MDTLLRYSLAVLGVALIVGISVFPAGAAIWIAFATAVAITAVAATDTAVEYLSGRMLAAGLAAATTAGAVFLIIASLLFEGVSRGWLMVVAGGTIEFVALASGSARRRAAAVASPVAEASRLAA